MRSNWIKKGAIALCLTLCLLPLLPGVVGLILSAFGYIPVLNQFNFSLSGFYALYSWPGIGHSISLTLWISLFSTLIATLITFSILSSCWQTRFWQKIVLLITPILALPHVAFAIGFVFLFSSSGFISRILVETNLSDLLTQWQLIKDPYGIGLITVLVVKEVPFLLFMSIAISKQLNIKQTLIAASSLGYSPAQTWQKIIFPQWLPKIRYSLFAVAAYGLSVVDMSLVIGPSQPPTFPILIWQWLNDANLLTLQKASSGSLILVVLCLGVFAIIRLFEFLFITYLRQWQINGRRAIYAPGTPFIIGTFCISFAIIPILMLWTFALRWRFPDILPSRWSLRFWTQEWPYLAEIMLTSSIIAILSASIAIVLAISLHELFPKELAHKKSHRLIKFLILIPMFAPQLALLFGMQVSTLFIESIFQHNPYFYWVTWAHLFFIFPYVFLALDGPWRSYDNRLSLTAASLGLSPLKTWWHVKRPILISAIWVAWALGISVSLSQYLPTLMLGAGRVSTLTTEAVALSSGHDRRVSAIYALLQSLLPLAFYLIAVIASHRAEKRVYNTMLNNKTKSTTLNLLQRWKFKL